MTGNTYTLISYRANGEKWFRNECEGRTDSEHEVQSTNEASQAALWWGTRLFENFGSVSPTRDWEVTLLINGRARYDDANTEELDGLFEAIETGAQAEFLRLKQEELERREQAELAKQAEAQRAQEARARALERQEYERLAKKFGRSGAASGGA